MEQTQINVEVVYASSTQQVIKAIQVPVACLLAEAVERSGILHDCPDIDWQHCTVGIFSRRVPKTTVLSEGDRIEIYRDLLIDPKQKRRIRAKKVS